jgi:hypothetical protein
MTKAQEPKSISETMTEVAEISEREKNLFFELARAASHGELVDAEKIVRAAQAAGRNPNEFGSLVHQIQSRNTLRAKCTQEQLALLISQEDEAAEDLSKINAELERAIAAHQQAAGPLQFKMDSLRRLRAETEQIPAKLLRESPMPGAQNRLRQLGRQAEQVSNALHGVSRDVEELERRQPRNGEASARLTSKRAEATRLQAQLLEINSQSDELMAEMIAY